MSVRVNCPHCRTPCLVAEQHLGVPVQCGRCARSFTTAPAGSAAPPLLGLDIAAAASSPPGNESFLMRRQAWSNLDEGHELALLMLAEAASIRTVAAALTPLLSNLVRGMNVDLATAWKDVRTGSGVVLIRDGEVHIVCPGSVRIHHQRAGRMSPLARSIKLAGGDWLLVSTTTPNDPALPAEMGKSSITAADLVRQLCERGTWGTVIVVRCC